MGADKQDSKVGAGYVGGFFQLFDWNLKSRKKLFPSKSDLPERLKQGKRTDANLPRTRLHLMNEDETGTGSSIKGSSDYSCASSVTDDEGARAPGVVARLMGLDTLPTSNSTEPFFDCASLRGSHCNKKGVEIHNDHQIMFSGNLPSKVDSSARNAVESRLQKMTNRPIEKFQTEILPPKSAKSIPVTHHKLLSPIKGRGFVPTKNAADIMEAAAKILEQGPQPASKAKVSPLGPSVLRIRDLKEKAAAPSRPSRLTETPRRPNESSAAKSLKGQSLNKSWNGSADSDAEENLTGSKNKGKSISLAVQAKANVQRREGLNTSGSRSFAGQKEQGDFGSTQSSNSQLSVQKTLQKQSTRNSSGVLKPNNQKQNCLDRDKVSPRPSISNTQGRKGASGESPVGRHKITGKSTANAKSGSRKSVLEASDSEKRAPYSKSNNNPRKKRSINGQRNQLHDKPLINKSEKPIQYNPENERHFDWAEESRKKGMDVVSFSFTAPMSRSKSVSESSNQVAQKYSGLFCDHPEGKRMLVDSNNTKLSTLGFNVIGGDALSSLLELKLEELTYKIGSPHCESGKVGTAANSMQKLPDLVPKLSTMPVLHDKRDHRELHAGKLGGLSDSDLYLTEPPERRMRHKFEGIEAMDEYSDGPDKAKHPSPISILDPFPSESCNSSDSIDGSTTEGSRQCSSVQAQEVIGLGSSKKSRTVETDTELSDSASSASAAGSLARKDAAAKTKKDSARSNAWEELGYVEDILSNVELMFKDFALGRAREIINPRLFDQLEIRKCGSDGNGNESRINRKVLFDCVSENLDLRCRRCVAGGRKAWAKGMEMVRRKRSLAEEVHKEIDAWRGMGDCMVDELVDKDMSSGLYDDGRWLDFEVEGFAVGSDIENQVFDSLVDDAVADIFLFR